MNVRSVNTVRYTTIEKKINLGPEAEVRIGHGYCDSSARWSNTALLQCFTRIPPSLLLWRQAHLPTYGSPWPPRSPNLFSLD